MGTPIQHFFTSTDYLLALPMIMLALFGMGVLIIDLMLPAEWKRANAWTALVGLGFSAVAVYKVQWRIGLPKRMGRADLSLALPGRWCWIVLRSTSSTYFLPGRRLPS